jgi:4-amino-4-deoxy-L-arabinose transferase-like glycosyltransferase
LVRTVAAIPVAVVGCEANWDLPLNHPSVRLEGEFGRDFFRRNGMRTFWLFTLGRWACIPFSVIGALVCYRWAADVFGDTAGLAALTLWCACPNIIGHAQLVTPDVGATSLGLLASYVFWKWLHISTARWACAAGLALGVAELTKCTWLVLFALWPGLSLLRSSSGSWRRHVQHVAGMLALAIYVLNVGYGFEGTFRRLGTFSFTSNALRGGAVQSRLSTGLACGNRFQGSCFGRLPVPLPENYVYGIDVQKGDFERRMWSYLRGEWRLGGWWYYYVYALLIKVPLGAWILFALSVAARARCRSFSLPARDEIALAAPAVAVLVFVSSQTGFNHHLRYVLPALPYVFISSSRLFEPVVGASPWWRVAAYSTLAWFVAASAVVYPHSLSYFNELVGGPRNGHRHLGNSNVDWGQDLLYLKEWLERAHPAIVGVGIAYDGAVDPSVAGIRGLAPPVGREWLGEEEGDLARVGPQPGWYAISVNRMEGRTKELAYFRHFRPVDWIGYSMCVYHITLDDANRVRKELGLPPLQERNRLKE